ncbi:DUF177 domain-containing protein [Pseudenhygromyxa sp. WMMC2535]|uniref:YceD family protein n=1 Tax=Pseudenhygromyxa sp. WMMC2535 TaxID=2712867 RepID=UPI0015560CFF|nr:DUF177 domain-containing protein [Pseudenhygromyxa sp. WMMC2535]NVB41640.1 DUF177 domain-containing protein [Pseudenhygromyxa sp. WMMC2535]NVB43494.1 DUF177 domain-containing protein [Pseudenhygromyxa sp. WMMC2535]
MSDSHDLGKAQAPSDDALILDLDQLEEGRHEREAELSPAWIAEALSGTDASVGEAGTARLEIDIQSDRTVLVRGRVALDYTVPCARCLDPAKVDVGAEVGDLCVTYVPAERLRVWAQVEGGSEDDDDIDPLESEELDQIGYQGHVVDLRALLAEQVLLTYPMRALCERGEACRGLCVHCGANLNVAAGTSQGEQSDDERCPSCGKRLDGRDDEGADTPWKRALSKLGGKPPTS